MKRTILFLFLFLPMLVNSQTDSARSDTLILDKFFRFAGKKIKKVFEEKPVLVNDTTSKKKLTLGLSVSYFRERESDLYVNNYLVPAIVLNYKKNSFSIGPKFEWYDYNDLELNNPRIQWSYKFSPLWEHRILNFYLQYTGGFSRYKQNYYEYQHQDTLTIVMPVRRTSTSIASILGYGIKLNIYKGLYLHQSFGYGVIWEKVNYRYGSPEIYSDYDIDLEGANLFILGIGINFK